MNCIAAPTVVILFRDKDSVIIGQLLIDFKCHHYNLFYLIDGNYTIVEDENQNIDFAFYSKANAAFLKIANKYKLSCIPD